MVFDKTCASCHTLFGEGGNVGPDITGSNRTDLNYILSNVVDPSAVLGSDYRMTVVTTDSGQIISGILQKETDSALTLRTLNDTVVVAKKEIDERQLSNLSLMPDGLLDPMPETDVRDLIAYLRSPTQVVARGPSASIDPKSRRVPDAIEGESMEILAKTHGNAGSQGMSSFSADQWSGDSQLWWTGGKPGSRLDLALPASKRGSYELEVVMTRARDYGIVNLALDGTPLGSSIDLYNAPHVVTTGVLTFDAPDLDEGTHTLSVTLSGANPQAIKSFMFGLDYVRLVPRDTSSRDN